MDDLDPAPSPAAAPSNPLIAEPAKSGRSNCKKCKGLIDKGSLRLGRVYDNGDRIMTSWYHPSCWPVPKKNFASVDEIEGWHTLSNEHKKLILDLVPGKPPRASGAACASASLKVSGSGSSGGGGGASGSILSFFGGATSAAASTSAGASSKTAPQPSRHLDESGGTFAEFVELCDRVASVGSTLSKSQLISSHLDALLARRIDPFLTVRLLMPSKSGNDLRVFSLKDKTLVVHMSTLLRCSEAAMSAHLESADDFGTTAEHFYAQRLAKIASAAAAAAAAAIGEEAEEGEEGDAAADATVSTLPPQGARLNLADVNGWLDRLAAPDTASLSLLRELVGRCNLPSELRVAMRLISKDLRIGGGTAIVLKGVGGDAAYDRFKAQPEQLRAIVSECKGGAGGGGAGVKAKAEGGAAAGAGSGSGSRSSERVGQAFKPQLAGQCKSFDDPVTKFARGFYVEVKYDGERLQCHLKNGKVKFFSRSLKDPPETKVR